MDEHLLQSNGAKSIDQNPADVNYGYDSGAFQRVLDLYDEELPASDDLVSHS